MKKVTLEDGTQATVMELWLCESVSLALRPNQLYFFSVGQDCTECKKLAEAYENISTPIPLSVAEKVMNG